MPLHVRHMCLVPSVVEVVVEEPCANEVAEPEGSSATASTATEHEAEAVFVCAARACKPLCNTGVPLSAPSDRWCTCLKAACVAPGG